MMPYIYILECRDGSYYTGSTIDLEKRLAQHQQGLGANYTKKRLPVKLVYCEEYRRVDNAFRREKQIQNWSKKKKTVLVIGNTDSLHTLAECRNASHSRYAPLGSISTPLNDRARGAVAKKKNK
ncbi:MAG: GIY-YIG nuclease family protein [Candidatus Edwardsbacteria bacterium]|nr:GIY-YIG nuclease family protein [Candidatus Edwardsbacteria bacterium]